MQFRQLGTTDTQVSAMAVGCWVMGGHMWADPNDDESIAAIQAALDAGLNFVDTAPAYGFGRSERIVGKAIKGRDNVVIATKCGMKWTDESEEITRDSSYDRILFEVDDALARMDVDVIDLMQVHWPDPDRTIAEPMEALAKAQEQGKIKHIGVSNYSIEQMDEARKTADVVSLQPPYSAFKRDIEVDLLPYCMKNGMAVLPYSPLERGVLTGKFHLDGVEPADDLRRKHPSMSDEQFEPTRQCLAALREIANGKGTTLSALMIAWTIAQPGITSVLVGARRPSQVEQNVPGAELELTDDVVGQISAALSARQEALAASGET
jgi:aryl-alcohol dehydrogenase-like predicted oxidoreductase